MNIAILTTDEQGYLVNFSDWDKNVAKIMAAELGISLTDKHWRVIDFIHAKYAEGTEMTVRSMGQTDIASVAELYQLFPGGPLKHAYKIAGLPRPKNCV